MIDKARKIENIISRDLGGRGIGEIASFYKDELYKSIESIVNSDSPSVAILTGFYIPFCDNPAAETDGPIGAAFLYYTLKKIGIPVVVITDHLCENIVKGAMQSITNLDQNDLLVAENLSEGWESDFLDRINVSAGVDMTHLVSIERPGQAKDGKYYNMVGGDLSNYIEPLDLLLPFCISRNIKTISVGDGGNEAGMGSIDRGLIESHIPGGDTIQSVVCCDYIIVCGVSNWGGFAISALLLHHFKKNVNNVLNAAAHHEILSNIVNKNHAIDGVIKERILKVDGLDELAHEEIISDIVSVF